MSASLCDAIEYPATKLNITPVNDTNLPSDGQLDIAVITPNPSYHQVIQATHEQQNDATVAVELQQSTVEEGGIGGPVRPEGGYGWVIVACICAINAVTWGINTVYGVYISYYLENNYFEGGTTMRYAWVGGACPALALCCSPAASWLTRHWGFRAPLFLGCLCIVVGQVAAGFSKSFPSFLVTQGIIFGCGLGFTLVPLQPLLAQWFGRRLARAQGLANAGSGLGALVLANTTRLAIETVGVKWSLVINGLVSLVVMLPAAILLRANMPPSKRHIVAIDPRLIVHPGFVWVWIWGSCCMMSYFIALYSLASFATNGLGFSQTQGAALQSILAAGQMLGRPLWGVLLDKGGRINMSFLCYIIAGLSCLVVWLPSTSFAVLTIFALIQGFTGGTLWSAGPPITATILPGHQYVNGLTIFWLACVPSSLVGQPIAVALHHYSVQHLSRTGPKAYHISIGFCGGLTVFGALILLGAKRWTQQSWKMLDKA